MVMIDENDDGTHMHAYNGRLFILSHFLLYGFICASVLYCFFIFSFFLVWRFLYLFIHCVTVNNGSSTIIIRTTFSCLI